MILLNHSRRSFLKTSAALAGTTPLLAGLLPAQSRESRGPLMAYVGTFSSPLRDVLSTQVDLPPGNGRGICIGGQACAGETQGGGKIQSPGSAAGM